MEDKTKKAGAPEGNTNAEKYPFELAKEMLEKAVETSLGSDFDFIGEVAKENKTTHKKLLELSNKYPELKDLYDEMKSNCEVNCFRNGKKGNINTGMAIMNLKSNHGWTDRIDTTTKDKELPSTTVIKYEDLSDEMILELAQKSQHWKE